MIFLDDVEITIQNQDGSPSDPQLVKALLDSGSGGIVVSQALLGEVPEPFFGPEMTATGFGASSRRYKTVLVQVLAPTQPFPVLLPAYLAPIDYFPPAVRNQGVEVILGNPWFALVGVLIQGERVVGYAGGTIG